MNILKQEDIKSQIENKAKEWYSRCQFKIQDYINRKLILTASRRFTVLEPTKIECEVCGDVEDIVLDLINKDLIQAGYNSIVSERYGYKCLIICRMNIKNKWLITFLSKILFS
jgi:hypothetical protein